jgi:hypothetical protein
MALPEISTQELTDRNISIFSSLFNQDIPDMDKAFYKALSASLAMIETEQVKKQINDAKQNLAITATNGLSDLGADRGIVKTPASNFVGTIEVVATNGTSFTPAYSWLNTDTGVRYFSTVTVVAAAGIATIQLTSEVEGTDGNLEIGDELNISSPLSGSSDIGTVTVIDTLGADEEDDEIYRQSILEDQRTVNGGGNNTDFRKWSNVVAGVKQSYPYSGLPFGDAGVDAPPDRTVYVEVTTDIDPDGIAPTSILDSVEAAIINDPVTGEENQALGIENSTLYVVSVRRTSFYTEIRGLDVPAEQVANIQAEITSAVELFYRSLTPYVEGTDFEGDKNNIASDPLLTRLVQDVCDTVGGTFSGLGFGLAPSAFIPKYELGSGELAKSAAGGVTFAA